MVISIYCSIYLLFYLSLYIYLSLYRSSTDLSFYQSIYLLHICHFIASSPLLSLCLSIDPSFYPSFYRSIVSILLLIYPSALSIRGSLLLASTGSSDCSVCTRYHGSIGSPIILRLSPSIYPASYLSIVLSLSLSPIPSIVSTCVPIYHSLCCSSVPSLCLCMWQSWRPWRTGGEGGSSNFLLFLLGELVDRGSDGAVMEAECHNNTGSAGTPGDGSEARERPRPKGPSREDERGVVMSCLGWTEREMGCFSCELALREDHMMSADQTEQEDSHDSWLI